MGSGVTKHKKYDAVPDAPPSTAAGTAAAAATALNRARASPAAAAAPEQRPAAANITHATNTLEDVLERPGLPLLHASLHAALQDALFVGRAAVTEQLDPAQRLAVERAICGASTAELSAVDGAGDTPLHVCCRHGQYNFVELCVARGADAMAVGRGGDTPLHAVAVLRSSTGVIAATAISRALLRAGAAVDARRRDDGSTALMLAAATGNMWLAHVLLAHDADDALVDASGADARQRAQSCGENALHRLLTQHARAREAEVAQSRGELSVEQKVMLQHMRQFLRLHELFYECDDHRGAGALGAAELNELVKKLLGVAPGLARMMQLVAHASQAVDEASTLPLSPPPAESSDVLDFDAFNTQIFDPFLQGKLDLIAEDVQREKSEAERMLQEVLDAAEGALSDAHARKEAAERVRAEARLAVEAAEAEAERQRTHLAAEDEVSRMICHRTLEIARRKAAEALAKANREVAAAQAALAAALERANEVRGSAERCMRELADARDSAERRAADAAAATAVATGDVGALKQQLANAEQRLLLAEDATETVAALRVALDAAAADATAAREERDAARSAEAEATSARDAAVAVASEAVPRGVTLRDDERYASYFRMLESGMPKREVADAMRDSGYDVAILDMAPDLPVAAVEKALTLAAGERERTEAAGADLRTELSGARFEVSALEAQLRDATAALERTQAAMRSAEATRMSAAVASARANDAVRRAEDAADKEAARELTERHGRETAALDAELASTAQAERAKLRARLATRRVSDTAAAGAADAAAAAAAERDAEEREAAELEQRLATERSAQLAKLRAEQAAREADARAKREAERAALFKLEAERANGDGGVRARLEALHEGELVALRKRGADEAEIAAARSRQWSEFADVDGANKKMGELAKATLELEASLDDSAKRARTQLEARRSTTSGADAVAHVGASTEELAQAVDEAVARERKDAHEAMVAARRAHESELAGLRDTINILRGRLTEADNPSAMEERRGEGPRKGVVVVSAKPKANHAASPPRRLNLEEPAAPVAAEDPPSRLSAVPAIQPVADKPLVVRSRRANADLSTAEGALRQSAKTGLAPGALEGGLPDVEPMRTPRAIAPLAAPTTLAGLTAAPGGIGALSPSKLGEMPANEPRLAPLSTPAGAPKLAPLTGAGGGGGKLAPLAGNGDERALDEALGLGESRLKTPSGGRRRGPA